MRLPGFIHTLSLLLVLSAGGGVAWAADVGDVSWIGTRVDPDFVPPGEIIVVEATLQTDLLSLADLTLRAIITDPKGIERAIDLPPTDVDHFAAAFRGTGQVGEHRVQVIAVGSLADGSRVEINPRATVFEVNEEAPPIPQLPPEMSPSVAQSPDAESQPEITQASMASEEAMAAGRQVMGYPPWVPYALGGLVLLLLLGGAAVIIRRRKAKTSAAAAEPQPEPAASEAAVEDLPAEEPAPQQEGGIPSLDPEPIEAVEEEAKAETKQAAEKEKGETPSEAAESGEGEATPEESTTAAVASVDDKPDSQPEAPGVEVSETSLEKVPSPEDLGESAEAKPEPTAASVAQEVEKDSEEAKPNDQQTSGGDSDLEEEGDTDKAESAPEEPEATPEGDSPPAVESEARKAAKELGENMSDEQVVSLLESALEEPGDDVKSESAEEIGETDKQPELEAGTAEPISQEELRALYDKAVTQVSGDKPSSRGESKG